MTRHEQPAAPDVLVVDDDRDNLNLLCGLLEARGCSVRLAPNGIFALESARATPPNLILLDIGLPDLDGYTVCELLKADPRTQGVPVIFLSARQATFDIVRAFAVGAVDYITKPFATEEVLARVRAHLSNQLMGQRLRRQLAQLEYEMSQRKQVEAALERARLAAEQAARAKSEFVAQISHEIRTPMNAVVGLTTLLLTSELTPAQRDDVEAIRRSSGALLTLIDDILNIAKLEAGKLAPERRPFALSACVEEALELLAPLAEAKQLKLRYLADPAVPHEIVGDQARLRQILVNLLSNAVRFTERGAIVVSLAGAPRAEAARPPLWDITISVRDTGIGIAPAQLDRIFRLFEQANSQITRQYGGSGLGLTISRGLAELMGGQIRVESAPGAGSTFTVELTAPATTATPPDYQSLAHAALAGRSALLLTDCAEAGEVLARQLSAWRMAPTRFAAAADALAWLHDAHPVDILLLAREDDHAGAIALVDELRAASGQPALPAVLWAGMAQRGQLLDQLDHDSTALLPLPIRPGLLHGALLRLLGGDDGARLAPQAHQIDPTLGRRHPLRILLAEDNAINQQVARRLLAKLGYQADVASNGLEVLEALKRESYDLVLMDVQMPEMTGVEATTHIRMLWPPQRWPRIAAVTAYASEENRAELLSIGMDDYIRKPMRLEDLVRVLQATRPRRPTVAPPPASGAAVLDEELFAAFVAGIGDEDPATDTAFIAAYVASMRAELRQLREAHTTADGPRLDRAAHTLKGLSLQLGALELASLCERIEVAGKAGPGAGVAELLGAAEGAFAALQRAPALHDRAHAAQGHGGVR